MRQEENPIYILANYVLGNFVPLEEIRAGYPNLIINEIAPEIYTIEIPPNATAEFETFYSRFNIITEPVLYGLNVIEALNVSNISTFHNYPYGSLRGNGILIGFVDTGIDYTNTVFKNADNTTRIIEIWDQTIEGNPPEGYQYGTVYTSTEINQALSSPDPYEIVPSRDEIGHGTFLAGVAAGNDQTGETGYVGGAPDSEIIMVKLRQASAITRASYLISEDEPAYQTNDIIAGVSYLVRASLRFRRPLVICIGLGSNYGAHNGTDIIENYLDSLSTSSALIVVTAAGNEGGSGHHYRGEIVQGGEVPLEVNVAEGEPGFSIFMWVDIPDKMTISVKSPLGQVIARIPIVSEVAQTYRFNLEQTVLTVVYLLPDPRTGGERVRIKLQSPTPGLWTITVYGDFVINGIFHMWLPRRGFIQANTRFLRPDPQNTVQIPGTYQYSFVVGAYDSVDGSVYIASSRGPTTDNIISPDIIAPGVNVEGPAPGGRFTTYTGTSVAAAIASSAAVLLLQWALRNQYILSMNTRTARSVFMRGAKRQPGVQYPNNIEGYGRLDLQASINNI